MTTEVDVDGSFFTFPDGWAVSKLDEWSEHSKVTAKPISAKACDLLAVNDRVAWLIEAKDYTYEGAKVPSDLSECVALKIWHSLALLHSTAKWGQGDNQTLSSKALGCRELNFALAVELPDGGRRTLLIQKPLADLRSALKKYTRIYGLSSPVVSNSFLLGNVPWQVRRDPERRAVHSDR